MYKDMTGKSAGEGHAYATVFKKMRMGGVSDTSVLNMLLEFLDGVGEMKYR